MFQRGKLFLGHFARNAKERLSRPETKAELAKFARDVVVITGTFHVVGTYLYSLTVCVGPSMEPTFDRNGDLVLVDKFSYALRNERFRNGDVVIAECPTDPNKTICKRIRGMSNDIVLTFPNNTPHPRIVRIPDTTVWLAGDNPANSLDSRNYGPVKESLLRGRVIGKFSAQFPFFHKISRRAPEDKTDYFEENRQRQSDAAQTSEKEKEKRSCPIPAFQRSSEVEEENPLDLQAKQLLLHRLERERDRVTGYQAVQTLRAIAEAQESGVVSETEAQQLRERFIGEEMLSLERARRKMLQALVERESQQENEEKDAGVSAKGGEKP